MKSNYTLLFCLIAGFFFSQHEDKVWYFGRTGAGLDFRNCTTVVKTNGMSGSNAFEGLVSICDATTGRLLFYSTGLYLIDSTFNIMPGSTNIGNSTSLTQQVIVRKPGSSNLYYYIVTDFQGGKGGIVNQSAKGIKYAVIDMTLNSGKGGIVSAHNPIKDTVNCEKLTVVRHSNGTDIWLIAHEYGNNNFLVYSITSAGINLVPAIYSVGLAVGVIPDNSRIDAIGELKASPNRNKLAFTSLWSSVTCLFDFNPSTGAITNPIQMSLDSGFGGYGVSFSPNSSKLYFTCLDLSQINNATNSKLLQFDLSSGTQTGIQNSKILLNVSVACAYRSLKLGPDGKIYVAQTAQVTSPNEKYLSVINLPDNLGSTCNFVQNGIDLLGQPSSWGLNNAMEQMIVPPLTTTLTAAVSKSLVCSGESVTLSVVGNGTSYNWLNGNVSGTSLVQTPTSSTIYTVTGSSGGNCSSSATIQVIVLNCVGVADDSKTKQSIYYLVDGGTLTLWSDYSSQLQILDAAGKVVGTLSLNPTNEFRETTTHLESGLYVIYGYSGKSLVRKKIVLRN